MVLTATLGIGSHRIFRYYNLMDFGNSMYRFTDEIIIQCD